MATATKHLEAIYQEITRQFAGNPFITVAPVDGDPPEKYEITYHIKGIYKDNSGEVQDQDNHVVTISIPFGFPHFPPSCKPKTPIFHPDFDPAAICIGDFWEKDRTIGDLITHIGSMISGRVFSTSNAFNEEAAKWYKDHAARLPFDQRDLASATHEEPFSVDDATTDDVTLLLQENDDDDRDVVLDTFGDSFDSSDDQLSPPSVDRLADSSADEQKVTVDTLDESFLETDYDFFGSERKDPVIDEVSPPSFEAVDDSSAAIDTDRFKLLAKQKRFYELNAVLESFAPGQDFADKERLSEQAATALKQAREFYNQGTDHEHQGDPGKAYSAFKQVEKVVSDYPGLTEDLERTAQAKELLGDWFETPQRSEEPIEQSVEGRTDSPEASTAEKVSPRKSDTRTFFEDTARQSSKLIPYAIAIVLLIVAATAVFSFFLNNSRLKDAQKRFVECQNVLKQNRFSEAERQCESALETAAKVQFFRSGARDSLIGEIETVLQSEVLHQGLAGNLFFEGRYLPKAVVKSVRAFNHFVQEGDRFFTNQDWQQALANYDQALALAAKEPSIDQEVLFAISEKQKTARFNTLLRSGEEYIRLGKWILATEDLEKALDLAKGLTIENKAEMVASLTGKLEDISMATAKEKGDSAFASQQWHEAVKQYRSAYEVAIKSAKRDNQAALEELKQLMVKAELYETINSGKNAFSSADWDNAIANYERAISILDSNSDLLKQNNTDENKKKLARTLLQAAVIRDKQEAAKFLKEDNYQAALEKLHTITATISNSDFAKDAEFAAIRKETEQAITQAETDRLLADKIRYLEEHFKDLFTKHYTASPAESLIDPTVIFEKQLGNQLIFRLECTEIGRGRPLKLVMKYSHDLKTGEWRFYSDTN